jgi:hypothetical protein
MTSGRDPEKKINLKSLNVIIAPVKSFAASLFPVELVLMSSLSSNPTSIAFLNATD